MTDYLHNILSNFLDLWLGGAPFVGPLDKLKLMLLSLLYLGKKNPIETWCRTYLETRYILQQSFYVLACAMTLIAWAYSVYFAIYGGGPRVQSVLLISSAPRTIHPSIS